MWYLSMTKSLVSGNILCNLPLISLIHLVDLQNFPFYHPAEFFLYHSVVILSLLQLTAFSQLQFPNGEQMVQTYRPVQPLNGRQVYYSGGHVALVSSVVLIVSVLVSSALSLQTVA